MTTAKPRTKQPETNDSALSAAAVLWPQAALAPAAKAMWAWLWSRRDATAIEPSAPAAPVSQADLALGRHLASLPPFLVDPQGAN